MQRCPTALLRASVRFVRVVALVTRVVTTTSAVWSLVCDPMVTNMVVTARTLSVQRLSRMFSAEIEGDAGSRSILSELTVPRLRAGLGCVFVLNFWLTRVHTSARELSLGGIDRPSQISVLATACKNGTNVDGWI